MERRFDMSDFEQSLKDHADQFKMIPSKRVWNGIYNNLHPGSKWPSITVAVVFILTLVTIGNFNNSSSHFKTLANSELKPSKDISRLKNNSQPINQISVQENRRTNSSNVDSKNILKISAQKLSPQNRNSTILKSEPTNNPSEKDNQQAVIHPRLNTVSLIYAVSNFQPRTFQAGGNFANSISPVNEQKSGIFNLGPFDRNEKRPTYSTILEPDLFKKDLIIPVSYNIFSSPPDESMLVTAAAFNRDEEVFFDENSLKQNTVLPTKKLHRKKSTIEWLFYLNPTVGTVVFNKSTQPSSATSSILVLPGQQPSFNLIHKKRIGMETGAEMSMKLSKKFRFITGFNFSYSGYTNVSNLEHPTFTTLILNDNHGGVYSKNYMTHYGNGQSQDHISLPNYNIEASIPLGIQYNIWGNNKIKIDVASLLEPSFVLKSEAYLISSDGRYYVNDPSLVRRENIDANFGAYITLTGKKIKWHLGPNVRYQLLSTFKNIYPSNAHLVDYGIKIGISK